MLDDQLVLHGFMGAFPVGSAWETTEAVHCGGASLGLVFFGAATALGMTSVKACPGPVWPAFHGIRSALPGRALGWRPRGVRLLPPSGSNGGLAFPPQAPVSGGPVAGEARGAWPTIEQGQQSPAHPRKPLITVSDIEGLPSAMRAQWPDVSVLPAEIITQASKYLTFVTRHDPKTPATVDGFVLLESIASRTHFPPPSRNSGTRLSP